MARYGLWFEGKDNPRQAREHIGAFVVDRVELLVKERPGFLLELLQAGDNQSQLWPRRKWDRRIIEQFCGTEGQKRRLAVHTRNALRMLATSPSYIEQVQRLVSLYLAEPSSTLLPLPVMTSPLTSREAQDRLLKKSSRDEVAELRNLPPLQRYLRLAEVGFEFSGRKRKEHWLSPNLFRGAQRAEDRVMTFKLSRQMDLARDTRCFNFSQLVRMAAADETPWAVTVVEIAWAIEHNVQARVCPRCDRWFLLAGPRSFEAKFCHACREEYAPQSDYRERLKARYPEYFLLQKKRRAQREMARRGTLSPQEYAQWERDEYWPKVAWYRSKGLAPPVRSIHPRFGS